MKYKEEYEKNKGKNFTEIPETAEMALSKELRPVLSKKMYSEKSKEMQQNIKLNSGSIPIIVDSRFLSPFFLCRMLYTLPLNLAFLKLISF